MVFDGMHLETNSVAVWCTNALFDRMHLETNLVLFKVLVDLSRVHVVIRNLVVVYYY